MNFPVAPVVEEIALVARLGFDYLELTMDPPGAHHQILHQQQKQIISELQRHNLGLVCHLPTFVATADLTPAIRRASVQEMHDSLEIAASLGAKKVVLHPSMVTGMGLYVMEKVGAYFLEFLSRMVNAAKTFDITICLENMMPGNILGVEPLFFEEIFTEFPSLMLTLDTGHANINDKESTRLNAFIAGHGNRLGHVHISDNGGLRDEHLAVGQGSIDFVLFIDALVATGYDETMTLEVFTEDRQLLVDSRDRLMNLLNTD